jgi:hypothetical protein
VRDADGTWNDRVFPRSASFGTAMSVLALLEADGAANAAAMKPPTSDDASSKAASPKGASPKSPSSK